MVTFAVEVLQGKVRAEDLENGLALFSGGWTVQLLSVSQFVYLPRTSSRIYLRVFLLVETNADVPVALDLRRSLRDHCGAHCVSRLERVGRISFGHTGSTSTHFAFI